MWHCVNRPRDNKALKKVNRTESHWTLQYRSLFGVRDLRGGRSGATGAGLVERVRRDCAENISDGGLSPGWWSGLKGFRSVRHLCDLCLPLYRTGWGPEWWQLLILCPLRKKIKTKHTFYYFSDQIVKSNTPLWGLCVFIIHRCIFCSVKLMSLQ